MRATIERFARGCSAALLMLMFVAGVSRAATITIVNLDGPGEGFNDLTPAAPVGGNPGTTIGAQRLYVFQYAANIWGATLNSNIQILVESNFDPLDCDSVSAVLGSAGPNALESDFPNAPRTLTWYHVALANRLADQDLEPTSADITAQFNSGLGQPGCFPYPWYYGVDGHEPANTVELLPVVLHEMGHGLGFSTSTIAGAEEVLPSIYDYFLFDRTQGMHWPDMTPMQRAASSQNCNNLVWDGPAVVQNAPTFLGPKPLLRVNSPGTVAGDMEVGLAQFGPALGNPGVTGNLVLAMDGMGVPTNGCEPFTNAAAVAGNIALVDRGACTFVQKALNAQAAGAIAVVVADSMPGCPPPGLGGSDPTITIPVVRIANSDGVKLKAALLLGAVNVTLRIDPAIKAGSDPEGRVQVYTPLPYQTGSSVSHWDVSATPDLLMEPALNQGLSHGTDLTVALFTDIGWWDGLVGVGDAPARAHVLEPSFPNPTSGTSTIAFSLGKAEHVSLGVYDLTGRLVTRLIDARVPEGRHVIRWDGLDTAGRRVPAGVYHYRLRSDSTSERSNIVMVH